MARRGLVPREEMKQIFREAAKACKEEAAPYKKGERFQHFKVGLVIIDYRPDAAPLNDNRFYSEHRLYPRITRA